MYEHAAYSVWCSPFVQMTIKQSAMKKVRNEQMHEKNRQQSSRSIDEANGERRKKEREEQFNKQTPNALKRSKCRFGIGDISALCVCVRLQYL